MLNTALSLGEYLFGFSPSSSFGLQWIPWTLCAIGIILAILTYIKSKTSNDKILRKILQEYPGKFLTITILLAVNILSRLNRIDVISMRIFTYVLCLWLVFAIYSLYKDMTRTLPERKARQSERIHRLEQKYRILRNKKKKSLRKKKR